MQICSYLFCPQWIVWGSEEGTREIRPHSFEALIDLRGLGDFSLRLIPSPLDYH